MAAIGGEVPPLFINGQWRAANSSQTADVIDPASGRSLGAIAIADAHDVDEAVDAAEGALKAAQNGGWLPEERQRALLALADQIEAHADELAGIESLDVGKPVGMAKRVDIPVAAKALRYFAGWAARLNGETMELSMPGDWHGYTVREPVGVVGQIIPWNYPLMGAAMKIGPALAAGCSVILKPSEVTPLSALRLGKLIENCGFPAGMVNILTGDGPTTGAALVAHPGVAKISFTGSTATGQTIARQAAATMKRLTLELGGKSPVIVMPDANLDAAAQAIAANIFLNAGQTCSAGSRLLVHADVAKPLVAKIAEVARKMQVGDPADPTTLIGPLVSSRQRERVLSYIDGARENGASCAIGGKPMAGGGYFIEPTILVDVHPGMAAVDEEIFGPVLCVLPFETNDLDEIATLANETVYGLSAYVWTANVSTALGLVRRIKAGTVRVNTAGGADFSLPSGGMRQSGFGREHGRAGVEAYTELKSVVMAY